jgi:hypothetical protein
MAGDDKRDGSPGDEPPDPTKVTARVRLGESDPLDLYRQCAHCGRTTPGRWAPGRNGEPCCERC